MVSTRVRPAKAHDAPCAVNIRACRLGGLTGWGRIQKKPDPKARRVLQGGTRGALGKRRGGEPSGMIIEP